MEGVELIAPFAPFNVASADPTVQLACFRASCNTSSPTVVFFHGNGELAIEHAAVRAFGQSPLAELLIVRLRLGVVLAEYRGYGKSGGSPSISSLLDDALCMLPACGLDPRRTIVFGRSIGALPALHVAAQQQPAALVLDSGVVRLSAVWGRAPELSSQLSAIDAADDALLHAAANVEAYTAAGGHVLLLHTEDDAVVPFESSAAVLERHARAPGSVRLVRFAKGGHNYIFPLNYDEYAAALEQFLADHSLLPRQKGCASV